MPAKKPLNQHVMTKAWREGLVKVYADALWAVGIASAEIQPHMNSSATIILTDSQLEAVRGIKGVKELSAHGNSGAIMLHIPAAAAYLKANRPTLTTEEREARKRSGTGANVGTKAEQEARRKAKAELDALLKEEHGIDLSSAE